MPTEPVPAPPITNTLPPPPSPPATPEPAPPPAPQQKDGPAPAPAPPSDEPRPRRGAYIVDPIPDECVLTAAEVEALVGIPVDPPAQGVTPDADGRPTSGCVVMAGTERVALINVYGVRTGTPTDAVLGGPPGGRRFLDGLGAAAAVVATAAGPTLQVAGGRYLVTIEVPGRMPDDDAWRAAGTAALQRAEGS